MYYFCKNNLNYNKIILSEPYSTDIGVSGFIELSHFHGAEFDIGYMLIIACHIKIMGDYSECLLELVFEELSS